MTDRPAQSAPMCKPWCGSIGNVETCPNNDGLCFGYKDRHWCSQECHISERSLNPVPPTPPCSECGHVPPHSFACSQSDASKAMGIMTSAPPERPVEELALLKSASDYDQTAEEARAEMEADGVDVDAFLARQTAPPADVATERPGEAGGRFCDSVDEETGEQCGRAHHRRGACRSDNGQHEWVRRPAQPADVAGPTLQPCENIRCTFSEHDGPHSFEPLPAEQPAPIMSCLTCNWHPCRCAQAAPDGGRLSERIRAFFKLDTTVPYAEAFDFADEVAALEAKLDEIEHWRAWWENEAKEWAKHSDSTQDKLAAAERDVKKWMDEAAYRLGQLASEKAARKDAERERDHWKEARERSQTKGEMLLEDLRRAERERDEAVAKERARCLAWALNSGQTARTRADAIRDGKQAPTE